MSGMALMPRRSAAWPDALASASSSRACARRSICAVSWLTSSTMRSASIWNLISSSASAAEVASSAEVGSSSSSTRGSSAIARTSPSRWRSPVESSASGPVEDAPAPAPARTAADRALACGGKCSRAVARPPGGLGRGIAHAPAPLGPRHLAPLHAVEHARSRPPDRDRRWRAACGLAGARRSLDGQAFARRDLEGERGQPRHGQIVDPQHRQVPRATRAERPLARAPAITSQRAAGAGARHCTGCQRILAMAGARRRRRRSDALAVDLARELLDRLRRRPTSRGARRELLGRP